MRLVEIGDICRFEYGKSLPEKTRAPGQFPVYGSNGPVGSHTASFTLGKTIIIGRKGSIGEVHISSDTCWPIDTTYFIDETCTDCDLDWLAYSLKYLNLADLNKASGVPGLNREDAYQQEIWLPETKEEQRQIAARLKAQLAEVETARQAAQVQLRDAALLRQRLLRQAFDALADGPHKVLGEWATITSGVTPARDRSDYWQPAEVPWVKTSEIDFAPISSVQESVSKKALAECSLSLLPPKTVLVAITGEGKTRGRSAVLEVAATTNQHSVSILPNDTWDAYFLQLWMQASYHDLRKLSEGRGGSRSALSGGQIKALEIPAPTIDDQRRIVTHLKQQLAEADALRAALEQQLRDLDALPQRILAQAFEN
jgi:type I restriction enzyme S subunit